MRSYKIFARLSMERFLKRYVCKSIETRVRFKVMFLDMSQGEGKGGLTSYLKWLGWGDILFEYSIFFFSSEKVGRAAYLLPRPHGSAFGEGMNMKRP